jgi:hypothetical protein
MEINEVLPAVEKNTKTQLAIARLRLHLERPMRSGEAPALRGFFGNKFEDEVLFHNHGPNDELIYQYPKVQYKVIDRVANVIGIEEGANVLERLWLSIDQTKIGGQELKVLESQFQWAAESIVISPKPNQYRFATPWLALNQQNFREYTQLRTTEAQCDKLNRTLVGNTLSLCKSLGIFLHERLIADCSKLTTIRTTLKGQPMVGFVGDFSLNLQIPDLLGLGKSVSRGFGAIEVQRRV